MKVEDFTSQVEGAFLIIVAISVVLLVGITIAMIYFVFRYHHTRHKTPKDIHGNLSLEIIWTVIPTIIVLGMFYYGWVGYRTMDRIPENALTVETIGRMWSWSFTYENGVQTDTLYVPVNQPVRLNLKSSDVIHSFYVPAFKVKKDVVPGVNNSMWLSADQKGNYEVMCAEYCGMRHSYMLTSVVAMPQEEFNAWYERMGQSVVRATAVEEEAGEKKIGARGPKLIQQKGCTACHTTDGSRMVGPSFKGIYGQNEIVLEDGQEKEITVDEEYIRRSIRRPSAQITKGFQNLMPPQTSQMLSDEELEEIVAYIKELK